MCGAFDLFTLVSNFTVNYPIMQTLNILDEFPGFLFDLHSDNYEICPKNIIPTQTVFGWLGITGYQDAHDSQIQAAGNHCVTFGCCSWQPLCDLWLFLLATTVQAQQIITATIIV